MFSSCHYCVPQSICFCCRRRRRRQYAALEEEHGLARAAKGVHDQAIAAKPSVMSKLLQRPSIFLFLLLQTPAEASGPVFLQYAALEEEHGLARAAMGVYDQAVRTVPTGERLPIYDVYLKRASDFFGIGKVSLGWGAPRVKLCAMSRCSYMVNTSGCPSTTCTSSAPPTSSASARWALGFRLVRPLAVPRGRCARCAPVSSRRVCFRAEK